MYESPAAEVVEVKANGALCIARCRGNAVRLVRDM